MTGTAEQPKNCISSTTGRRHRLGGLNVTIQFFSYFRELTGLDRLERAIPEGTRLGELHDKLCAEHPALNEMSRSTLLAVGVDYQTRDYQLRDGDVVSLFPPVQGG